MSDFDEQFEKEIKREKTIAFIFWSAIIVYLIYTVQDSDVGNAQLLWGIMGYGSFIIYKINKLEELIFKIHARVC